MKQDLDWQQGANCTGIDTEEFFVPEEVNAYANVELLTRICNNCNVKQACLNYALHNNVLGWWGNTTENKRKKLRRQLNITAVPVVPDKDYR